ncbi:MAG: glycosyltransferase [bacterium]|nr:glycosyltransferase [bacterium]
MMKLSIIVPTYNEEGNISSLIKRLDKAFTKNHIEYEIIIIDDHSTDQTREVISLLPKRYPIFLFTKMGKKGKAYSLIEGLQKARYDYCSIIDADLQYPPEYMPLMLSELKNGFDVVVAERKEKRTSIIRKVFSYSFKTIFGKLLHGLDCDVQSGLKVFKKEIIDRISLNPTPWTFDLEFLLKARDAGYKITTKEIMFEERYKGQSKVKLLATIFEIGLSAIKLKFKPREVIALSPKIKEDRGFHYRGRKYITYNGLHYKESALLTLSSTQAISSAILLSTSAPIIMFNWHASLSFLIGTIILLYFSDILFNLFLIVRSFIKDWELKSETNLYANDDYWPTYTVLCPLYKEWQVLPQFISAMSNFDYPKNKLQVLLLLEESDQQTIDKAKEFNLPDYFKVLIVPDSMPRTKPKACNYGLLMATGKYSVIYDAEDIPERDQLKKAVLAFEKAEDKIICVQAKLNFYNSKQNILTRLFTSEYSLWFNLILTGLQSIKAPIPLGGTSNHFRTEQLKKLEGWDAFNVTEDCDLGIRLAKRGYRTAIIDSTTNEEANSQAGNWFLQRTRWVKGYMQTYLVHVRGLRELFKNGRTNLLGLQLIIGGKVLSMFINPILWVITIVYFAFRPQLGGFIESFFPTPILYMSVFSVVVGNFLYLFYYMIACTKKGYDDLIKYCFLVPFYWIMMSAAAWVAVYKLIKQPHYWSKTVHGFHLKIVEASKVGDRLFVSQPELSI